MGDCAKLGKGLHQEIGVAISLLYVPLLDGVSPNRFKIVLGSRGKAIFSHEWPAFSA